MNETISEIFKDEKYILHQTKFVILLTLQIQSIIILLLMFIFFFTHRAILHIRQNQALFVLLIVNFIQVTFDLPMVIHFNRLGRVSPATNAYCKWWTFLDYTLNGAGEMLMATISIQRHILIFHVNFFNNRSFRYLFHHLPLLICIVYPIILYLIIIVFDSCDGTQWDYQANICGLANCYLVYNKVLGTFDWGVNNGLPIFVIVIANVGLVLRVVRQRLRRQGLITWRKQRRMTIQLFSVSFLYFFAWFPNIFIGIIQQLFNPTFLFDIQFNYIFDLIYLIYLLLPWVCLGLFPEFIKWIRKLFSKRNQRQMMVRPIKDLT